MKANDIKRFYRSRYPHLQPIGAAFFVTFTLKDSIPKAKLVELKEAYRIKISNIKKLSQASFQGMSSIEHHRLFKKYQYLLNIDNSGNHYLKQPEIAKMIQKELHRFDGDLYDLVAYCVMSNHVHILIDTSIQIPEDFNLYYDHDFEPLQNIMKRIKGPTAVYSNRILKRSGQFWQRESYDRYIRDDKEFRNVVNYILENPVKAGLVSDWTLYPYSYFRVERMEGKE